MKVGYITEPNEKGQIVIPKNIRDALEITSDTSLNIILRGEGIYIYPIEGVLTKTEAKGSKSAYLELLKKTRGAWADDKTWEKTRRKRRKIELEASKRRKTEW